MKTAILKLITAAVLMLCLGSQAATQIVGYVTITNTPAGLSSNIVLNIGSADTRYWTNSVLAAPTTSIQTTNSTASSATNLVAHLTAYPVYSAGAGTPQLLATLNSTNTSVVNLYAPDNTNITVTFVGNWARVVYVTNTYADGVPILNRTNSMSSAARTNAGNSIVNLLAAIVTTNAVPLNAVWLRNYSDTNTAQTLGNKTIIGPVVSGGRLTGITNLVATNVFGTNLTLHLATITGANVTGTIGSVTNGTIYGSTVDGVRGTNLLALAGQVHQLISGSWSNGTMVSPTIYSPALSNANIFGNTTVTGASITMIGSGVNNLISITATSTIAAVGPIFFMARENGITNAVDSGDVLGIIGFTGWGTTAQKVGARMRAIPIETFTDSTAGTVMLFETTPSGSTTPVGRLHIGSDGNITITNSLIAGAVTNANLRGTNTINGRLDYTPRANSSLANGYNSGVVLGTNVYVKMSGPSGAYTNVGFAASAAVDGTFHIVRADNPGLSFTILNDSGLDATAANRVITGTGALKNSTNNPVVFSVIYDGTASRWNILSWPQN